MLRPKRLWRTRWLLALSAVFTAVPVCIIGRVGTDLVGVWQYADRKILKRDMRALWIQRINAGTREHGLKYGDFIHGQKLANVALDRKVLADLAVTEPSAFKSVVELARDALVAKMSSGRAQAQ